MTHSVQGLWLCRKPFSGYFPLERREHVIGSVFVCLSVTSQLPLCLVYDVSLSFPLFHSGGICKKGLALVLKISPDSPQWFLLLSFLKVNPTF